jgi:hypothetical protein
LGSKSRMGKGCKSERSGQNQYSNLFSHLFSSLLMS